MQLPRAASQKSNSSMQWPELDLMEVPFQYLLDRMDRDRETTAGLVGCMRRQAKAEEKYCVALSKCFEEPKQKPGGNILNGLRDLMGEGIEKPILDDVSESTAGFLSNINTVLCAYAQERGQFAKFLDAKFCAHLEQHVAARSRTYEALKKDRLAVDRDHDEALRRVEGARAASQRAKRDHLKEEAELQELSKRGEDPMSENYDRQLRR